jgi:hypothetical protein
VRFSVAAAMMHVAAMIAFGHQHFHRLAQQFVSVVAEKFCGLRVDQRNLAICVANDHGVGSSFQERPELVVHTLFVVKKTRIGGATPINYLEIKLQVLSTIQVRALRRPGVNQW